VLWSRSTSHHFFKKFFEESIPDALISERVFNITAICSSQVDGNEKIKNYWDSDIYYTKLKISSFWTILNDFYFINITVKKFPNKLKIFFENPREWFWENFDTLIHWGDLEYQISVLHLTLIITEVHSQQESEIIKYKNKKWIRNTKLQN